MGDSNESGGVTDDELVGPSGDDSPAWKLTGMVVDGAIGATAGLVGSALLTVALVAAASVGGFRFESFAALSELVPVSSLLGVEGVAGGYALFLLSGITTWPLLLASLADYLPGASFAAKGLAFGAVLWVGFALAFYEGYAGTTLAVYVLGTLVGHLGYGFVLGRVFDYLGGREETLV